MYKSFQTIISAKRVKNTNYFFIKIHETDHKKFSYAGIISNNEKNC